MADVNYFDKYGSLRTKISIRSVSWIVQNFLEICEQNKNIRSDLFKVSTLPNCSFYITMVADANTFTIYVYRCVSNILLCKAPDYTASIVISLEDIFSSLHFPKELTMTKGTTCVSASYDQIVARDFLIKGNLQIHCSVTVEESKLTDSQIKYEKIKEKLWSHCSAISVHELKEHIEVLLDGDASNKVIITVDGEDFSAHKNMLCSNSPVFSAMFSHETLEKQHNRIYIDDIPKEVIGEMLKYIYTGCTSSLSPVMNIELFIAADKYAIFSLKERCSKFLAAALNQELVLDVLVLSHQYADNDLKNTAVQFLIEKSSDLLEKDNFISFIESESELIRSILLTLVRQVSK